MTVKKLWSGSLLAALFGVIFLLPFIPLDVQRKVSAPFLNLEGSEKAIVFFGFTHCADMCPATLGILRNVMSNIEVQRDFPQVAFVDIDSNSSAQQAQQYAQQFHRSFIGVHAKSALLAQLRHDFGLNIQQVDEQIQHKSRTYLLNRKGAEWHLVKVFNPSSFDANSLTLELY